MTGSDRTSQSQRKSWLLPLQGLILSVAAITFALLPPINGPILLVPLGGHGAAGLIGTDLRLLGAGRLPGSLIVIGAHPSFLGALVDHGTLILPAVPLLCGSADRLER